MEPMQTSVAAPSAWTILAGAVGAFVSLNFFAKLSVWERWMTFVGGWGMSIFLAGPLTAFFDLRPGIEHGIAFMVGLFGMSIAAAVIRILKDTKWADILKNRFGRNGGAG